MQRLNNVFDLYALYFLPFLLSRLHLPLLGVPRALLNRHKLILIDLHALLNLLYFVSLVLRKLSVELVNADKL